MFGIHQFEIEDIEHQVEIGEKVFLDSETSGLNGVMVLFQFQIDDGPIYLYHVWKEPVWKTLKLFEMLMGLDYVGFNLVFDHFHVQKIYTIFKLLPSDWIPEQHIEEIAIEYERAGQDGPCIKPKRACDLLLWSRKGKFQAAMRRKQIRIRKVPTPLAQPLCDELEERVELPDICFAKSNTQERWKVLERKGKDGKNDPDFKDVVLSFNPAGGLKYLAEHALGHKPKYHYAEIEVDKKYVPDDSKLGYIPSAIGMSKGPEDNWAIRDKHGEIKSYAWPKYLDKHIEHWYTNEKAIEYAYYDVVYTHELYEYFGSPEPGDDDSELACMVGSTRWHGFEINVEGLKKLLAKSQAVVDASPVTITKITEVRDYIKEAMDDLECLAIEQSTKKAVLQAITKLCFDESEHGEECTKCLGTGCVRCRGAGRIDAKREPTYDKTGVIDVGNHPAAERAKEILNIKAHAKEIELFQKLLRAGKFHANFNVIGTLSTRMSGGGGLNPQGIKHDNDVRSMFPLKWGDMVLSGGDADSFEVVLACTVYQDEDLFRALTEKKECQNCVHGKTCRKCNGTRDINGFECTSCNENGEICKVCGGKGFYRQKIHALFGMAMYPGKSYEDILESSGTSFDMYTRGKSGVFGLLYGGDWHTLVKNFGISEQEAQEAEARFFTMFPGIPAARQRVIDMFCSMKQIDGKQIIWREPADEITSFLGFSRSFKIENSVCRVLFNLAKKMPKNWREVKLKVIRSIKKGVQSAFGAVSSALYAAAFNIQASNTRAAANHEIQSPGGQIIKHIQRRVWDLQPHGVHEFRVAPLNVHDEIMVVNDMPEEVAQVVKESTESFRDLVPLIGMTWSLEMDNWAEKKGGSVTLKITPPEMST